MNRYKNKTEHLTKIFLEELATQNLFCVCSVNEEIFKIEILAKLERQEPEIFYE